MNNQRLAVLIVAGLGMTATFLPWINSPLGTINGTKGDYGWVTLGLFAIPLIISLFNDRAKELNGFALFGSVLPSIIAGLLCVWKIIEFNSEMSNLSNNPFSATISIGFGLYLVVLASITLTILAFLIKDKNNVRQSQNIEDISIQHINKNHSKMEVYQIKSKEGNTYMVYRYYDDHNKNYEYYIYKLVKSKPVAREFGVPEKIYGRESELNTREMCDKLIEMIKNEG